MEKVKIVGLRWVDMTAENNRTIRGWTLYIEFAADNVTGVQTGKTFISESMWPRLTYTPSVGDDVMFLYNRNGRVSDVRSCSETF